MEILEDLFKVEKKEFEANPERAEAFMNDKEIEISEGVDSVELAAYGVVASAIINLRESLQKN